MLSYFGYILYRLYILFLSYFIFNCEAKKKLKEEAITHLLVERVLISRIMHNKWIVITCQISK